MTELAVVAIVQNEARHLPEWIRYHRAIGVEQFFLYDNDSTDSTAWIATRLGANVIQWPGRWDNPQLRAHEHALAAFAHARWIAFIDPDEYIYVPWPRTLLGELEKHKDSPAVGLCWACFGTSDLVEPPRSIAAYTRRSAPNLSMVPGQLMNAHIKSIVQPHLVPVHRPRDPHHFLCRTVDTLGLPIEGPFRSEPNWHGMRINHYISRSIPEARKKMETMRVNTNNYYEYDLTDPGFNEVEDRSMASHLEALCLNR